MGFKEEIKKELADIKQLIGDGIAQIRGTSGATAGFGSDFTLNDDCAHAATGRIYNLFDRDGNSLMDNPNARFEVTVKSTGDKSWGKDFKDVLPSNPDDNMSCSIPTSLGHNSTDVTIKVWAMQDDDALDMTGATGTVHVNYNTKPV